MDSKRFPRHLRRNRTDAERRLWRPPRGRGLDGQKFPREEEAGADAASR